MRRKPCSRSSRASGSGDWWKEVRRTASSAPDRVSSASRSSTAARSTGGAGSTIQGQAHSSTCVTPGSRRAAGAPWGPQSRDTATGSPPTPAATARTAGPASRTSPTESSRATRTCLTRRSRREVEPGGASGGWRRRPRPGWPRSPVRPRPPPSGSPASGRGSPRAPAAAAAPTSAPMSPTTTTSRGAIPRARAAASTRPGWGLRQGQPSSGPCGQTCQVSKGPKISSTRAFTAASSDGVISPRASPDWLLTTPRGIPASRSARTAASAVGIGSTSAGSRL